MFEDAVFVLLEIIAICLEVLCAILNVLYVLLVDMKFIHSSLVSKGR